MKKGFRIRAAKKGDLRELLTLATSHSAHGFLSLPNTSEELKKLINLSCQSFSGRVSNPNQGEYLFVLEDCEKRRVVGCSMILALHGTPESPHTYFEVLEVQKAAPRFKKVFKHQVLRLRLNAEGLSEVGGLIVHPEYRGHPLRLGKAIALVRFLYIRRHSGRFQERLLAELLPPLTPEGKSLFWEGLGRRFTGLDYQEADRLSRGDKGFIFSLFPEGDFYTAFLPDDARGMIGQVGAETQPVARMLREVGFRYLKQIDPFDGGPHFGVKVRDLKMAVVEEFFEASPILLEMPT